jgi:hypothetical protein
VARAAPMPPANPAAPTAAPAPAYPRSRRRLTPGVEEVGWSVMAYSATAAVSLDSGSDSACTASDSARISGLVRSV